ncbi:MAG: hypothetical protein UV68_C0066G0001, partial [Candidatus Collierbacteria bacterium GW2011_GWC2_43_12]
MTAHPNGRTASEKKMKVMMSVTTSGSDHHLLLEA